MECCDAESRWIGDESIVLGSEFLRAGEGTSEGSSVLWRDQQSNAKDKNQKTEGRRDSELRFVRGSSRLMRIRVSAFFSLGSNWLEEK
jgi:hypothetical protein